MVERQDPGHLGADRLEVGFAPRARHGQVYDACLAGLRSHRHPRLRLVAVDAEGQAHGPVEGRVVALAEAEHRGLT